MASGSNGRRGFVQRIKEARAFYRGPFCGDDFKAVVENAGYRCVEVDGNEEFLIYRKEGRKSVPVNSKWAGIYDDDPVFKCFRRDLGMARSELRTLLNMVRDGR